MSVAAYNATTLFERNGDPSIGNDTNPDNTAGGESSETPADKRYFYVFDRTAAPVAMTSYTSGGGGSNGQIAERYSRGPHGSRIIQRGDSGSGEDGGMVAFSPIGNGGLGQTLPCGQVFGAINGPHPVYITSGAGGDGDCSDNSPTEPVDPVDPTGPCPPGQVTWGGGCIPEEAQPSISKPEPWNNHNLRICTAEWSAWCRGNGGYAEWCETLGKCVCQTSLATSKCPPGPTYRDCSSTTRPGAMESECCKEYRKKNLQIVADGLACELAIAELCRPTALLYGWNSPELDKCYKDEREKCARDQNQAYFDNDMRVADCLRKAGL